MKGNNTIVHLHNVVTRLPELRFTKPFSRSLKEVQQWALFGLNGVGQSTLLSLIYVDKRFKLVKHP